MSLGERILLRMFGRPRGVLGRLGGLVLALANRSFAEEMVSSLDIRGSEWLLEVGFGPGVGIALLAEAAPAGTVAGIDPSREMVQQARARNAAAIGAGRVDLRLGTAEAMPFDDDSFDTVLAINSMQVWRDAAAGLREVRRVLRPGGRVALGFTPRSGQQSNGLAELLSSAGFDAPQLTELRGGFCVAAGKPEASAGPGT